MLTPPFQGNNKSGKNRIRVVLVVLLTVCMFGSVGAQAQSGPSDAQSFLAAVSLVESAFSSTNNADNLDLAWNRLWRIYQYRDSSFRSQAFTESWASIEENTRECLEVLSQIAEIDQDKPNGLDLFVKTMRNNDSQEKKEDRDEAILTRILAEMGKVGLQSKFRDDETSLSDSISSLAKIGASFSNSQLANGISMAYLPSWQGTYANDMLELRNTSNRDINDAALFVVVQDRSGYSRVHVHYLDHWARGSELDLKYAYYRGDYTISEAVATPASVNVAVYMPYSGTMASASHTITNDEWNKILDSYLQSVTFQGNFLGPYVEDQTGKRYPSGIQLSFKGLSKLPVKAVTVMFWTGDRDPVQVRFPVDSSHPLTEATTYTYRSDLFEKGVSGLSPGSSPLHVKVRLELAPTNYQTTVSFY